MWYNFYGSEEMKKLLTTFICFLVLSGCSSQPEIKSHLNDELKEIILSNNYIVVDVRTEEEYENSHVKGAINIPHDEIDNKIKLDKTKKILVYCASGNRSGIAYELLVDLGYDVYDLGGYENITLPKE